MDVKSILGALIFIVVTIAGAVWIFTAMPGIGKPIDVEPLMAVSAAPRDTLSRPLKQPTAANRPSRLGGNREPSAGRGDAAR